MTALVISDIHLGTATGGDLLRRPAALAALAGALDGIDELILLGDLLELREAPVGEVLEKARPVLGELGRALAGRRVTIVPGNHDHQLAAWLVEGARLNGSRLELETIAPPPPAGPLAAVADALGGELRIAYPGVWLRPDVFATHGHYLDLHNTVPTLERVVVGLSARLAGGLREWRLSPADYEDALGPVYALTYQLAQGSAAGRRIVGGGVSVRAWNRLGGTGSRGVSTFVLASVLLPGAVALLNRAGLGPLRPELNASALRRGGLAAMGAVLDRLGVDASFAVFGHTHRAGPFAGDEGWTLASGTRLVNCGSWVVEPAFLGRSPLESPYFPGTCVVVPDTGPPRLVRLLDELPVG